MPKKSKSQDCDLAAKIQFGQVTVRDNRDGQWTLKPRTLTHCCFSYFICLAVVTLLFALLLSHWLPLLSLLYWSSTGHATLQCTKAQSCPLFFSIYTSPLVSSYSLWLLKPPMCWWLQNTHLWLRCCFLFQIHIQLLIWHVHMSTLHPGSYVKSAPPAVFTISFDGHPTLSIALAKSPQSSSLISWFLLQPECRKSAGSAF